MYPNDLNLYQQSQNLIQNQLSQMLSPQPSNMQKHIVKVNGRAGAESYQLAPNSDDILLDMNDPVIYFVQTDGAGYKTITPYDISPHKEISQTDKFRSLDERITKLEEAINNGKPNYRPNEQKSKPGDVRNDAGGRGNDQR